VVVLVVFQQELLALQIQAEAEAVEVLMEPMAVQV
jgi:hypothetical protein